MDVLLKGMKMNRRNFLMTTIATSLVVQGAWAQNYKSMGNNKFLFVFLRGGMDGLNAMIPHASDYYYESRSSIAIPRQNVLKINEEFGLHPNFLNLYQLHQQRQAAFIHCSGTPNMSRSHFETQDYVEMGCDVSKPLYANGFLNRCAQVLSKKQRIQVNTFTNNIPQIFKGNFSVDNVQVESNAKPRTNESDYERLYQNSQLQDYVKRGYEQESKVYQMSQAMDNEMMAANGKANNINNFAKKMQRTAHYMAAPSIASIGFIDVGGWDTHVNEGAVTGQLANNFKNLDEGLQAFKEGVGTAWKNTTVVVMSEFGRTVHQNGTGGTDHGHGNVMMVLGGNLSKSGVQGRWEGLTAQTLNENRDLKVLNDYRNVLRANLGKLYDFSNAELDYIFPNSKSDILLV